MLCLVLWPLRCLNAPDFGNTVVMVCFHMKELVKFWNQYCRIYNLNLIHFCEQIINISIRHSFVLSTFSKVQSLDSFLNNYLFEMELVFKFSGFILEDFIDCD